MVFRDDATDPAGTTHALEFGPFRLLADGRLLREGCALRLGAAEAEVLRRLAEAGGAVVSRDVLTGGAGSTIPPRRLNHVVHALRLRLGDAPGRRPLIESAYGRGYRLALPVRRVTADPW